ncbi:MAG: TRAP transporter small permease subunit [Tropicimonas sp.]|uniref:TRAP transporter small permease subunit n=1 Tax=Tropicimonas sp. TaxID=2067044 RepID=UPI003A88DD6D
MNPANSLHTRPPGPTLGRFIAFADALALLGGRVAMGCLVLMAALMLAQVSVAFLSKFTTSIRGDIPVAWEYGSYLMGTTFLLGSAITLRADRHIRLGVVIQHCNRSTLRVLEIISAALALAFTVYLTIAFGQGTQRALAMGTTSISSATPLWIPLSVFCVGTGLLALQFAVRLTCAVMRFDLVNPKLRAGGEITE